MWYVELNFRGKWVRLPYEYPTRADAEWIIALWKQEHKMTGDPFRYIQA